MLTQSKRAIVGVFLGMNLLQDTVDLEKGVTSNNVTPRDLTPVGFTCCGAGLISPTQRVQHDSLPHGEGEESPWALRTHSPR